MSFCVTFLQCVSQNFDKIHSVVVIFIRDNTRKCETINANNFIKRSCSAKTPNKNTLHYFCLSVYSRSSLFSVIQKRRPCPHFCIDMTSLLKHVVAEIE